MGHLQIRNIPPALHEAVHCRAAEERMTMSNYIIALLEEELALPSWREWLEELHMHEPVDTGGRVVAHIHAGREERDSQLAAAHERR